MEYFGTITDTPLPHFVSSPDSSCAQTPLPQVLILANAYCVPTTFRTAC